MTILTCECGNEIYIMDETAATAWQCEECGQWYDFFGVKVLPPEYDFFGVKVLPPEQRKTKPSPHLINWSAGEEL